MYCFRLFSSSANYADRLGTQDRTIIELFAQCHSKNFLHGARLQLCAFSTR